MVLFATIGALTLYLSSLTSRQTVDIFLKQQAEILAKSATQVAVLKLSKINFNDNCPKNKEIVTANFPNDTNPILEISVKVTEIFGSFGGCGTDASNVNSTKTVILDTFIKSSQDLKTPIAIHRRTIQKL